MTQNKNGKFLVFISTLAAAGLIFENLLLEWEFWIPVVVIAGLFAIWGASLTERIDDLVREIIYLGFASLLVFFHGVHKSSFFDTGIFMILVMTIFSVLNRVYMMNILLFEYFVILFMHFINLPVGNSIVYDKQNISRILFHIAIVILVYFVNVRAIYERSYEEEDKKKREKLIEINDNSMEDFLSNISHELRTPVNVVNGMSDLLMKKGAGSEAESIKNAGVRLAYQIEDIQDYTECKRQNVFLEEDDYMSTSLINDVVTSFRMSDGSRSLEMVVDLDPDTPNMMRGDIRKLHKIFRHLLDNAIKFTSEGGIYVKLSTQSMGYGVNLCIEVTDTGIGMDRKAIHSVSEGMFQANKKRNRSSGGIGLGLFIVYGFSHRMGGFVKIESEKNKGTTVRVTIPQKVVDPLPCLRLNEDFSEAVLYHVRPDKYKIPKLRDFYRNMATNFALKMHVPLYSAETVYEVERLKEKVNAGYVFMDQEEYEENRGYFEELAKEDIVIAVSADQEFTLPDNSRIILMPKPIYSYSIMKVLNEGRDAAEVEIHDDSSRPVFKGVRALVVDDEPMNLVVASCLFRDYEMVVDTADSGKDALRKFRDNDYDIVFMDHMMPEMDGVEAMKRIKEVAGDMGKDTVIVALTANAVSGAREMFIKVGFDGFIAKPINTADFERVMLRVLNGEGAGRGGDRS